MKRREGELAIATLRVRNLRFVLGFLFLVALLGFVPGLLRAQQVGPIQPANLPQQKTKPQKPVLIPQAPGQLRVQVSLVHLYATVRNKHGELVTNLTKDNFKVYENGVEQKIAYFNLSKNLPLTIALLIDTSGSQMDLLPGEQDAAEEFLRRILTPRDLAMVVGFDFGVNMLADFTNDRQVLDDAIEHTRINAGGPAPDIGATPGTVPSGPNGTHFYDAVYLTCENKLTQQAGRKAIIALTDAQDYGSHYTLDQAIEAAQKTDTVVHVVLAAEPSEYGYLGYFGRGVAEKLTKETGGRLIPARSGTQLDRAFRELADELRSQYVIGYYPSDSRRDGTYRKIKLETTPKKYKVLTRAGYYAPY